MGARNVPQFSDDRRKSRFFAWQATAFFSVLSLAPQLRLLQGRVPIPGEIVTRTALLDPFRRLAGPVASHASQNDLVWAYYPWRHFYARALRMGTIPFWNHHALLGVPFLANLQQAVFYPPNMLLYGLLPTSSAWSVSFWLRPVLAGTFAVLFARAIGSSRAGAIVAGVIFSLCGYMVGYQGFPHVDVMLWLPLICYAIHKLHQRPTWRRAALTGLCFALPLLAGQPEPAVFATGAGVLFALHRLLFPPFAGITRTHRNQYVAMTGIAGLLALGLAAVQLVPGIAWIPQLLRFGEHQAIARLSLVDVLSFASRDAQADPNSSGLIVTVGASYASILALFLAPLAWLRGNRRDVTFFSVLLVGAALLAYNIGPSFDVWKRLPAIGRIMTAHGVALVDFSIAVLAALGITALGADRQSSDARDRAWWVLICSVLIGTGLAVIVLYRRTDGTAEWFRSPHASMVLVAAAFAICTPWVVRRFSRTTFHTIVLSVIVLELSTFAFGHVPMFRSSEVFPTPAVFTELRERDPTLYRIASLETVYPPNLEMVYGLDSPTGYDFVTRDDARLFEPIALRYVGYFLSPEEIVRTSDRRLDLMNVKYLFAFDESPASRILATQPARFAPAFKVGHLIVFENRSVQPRAFLVPTTAAVLAKDDDSAFAMLSDPGFDPRRRVIVTGRLLSIPATPGGTDDVGSVRAIRYGVNEVSLEVEARAEAILVLSDKFYPGWKVLVDGRSKQILRVNGAFKGAVLPPGEHVVRFVFRPRGFAVGAGTSLLSVALVLILVLAGRNGPRAPDLLGPADV